MKKIPITGGAGFIDSHLCDELLKNNYSITVLDNLSDQVQGEGHTRPEYLNEKVELIQGDVRDSALVENLVKDSDAIFHFALYDQSLSRILAKTMGKEEIEPEITGEYRVGDIRHCFADISKANRILGYSPEISLEAGMKELAEWLESQFTVDHVDKAKQNCLPGVSPSNSKCNHDEKSIE